MADEPVTVSGISGVSAGLRAFATMFSERAAVALNEIAEVTMTDAKDRTPVDTGRLMRSGFVSEYATASTLRATLAFGTDYAVYVHENLRARHTNGEAKFLEHAVQKAAATFEDDLAKGIAGF